MDPTESTLDESRAAMNAHLLTTHYLMAEMLSKLTMVQAKLLFGCVDYLMKHPQSDEPVITNKKTGQDVTIGMMAGLIGYFFMNSYAENTAAAILDLKLTDKDISDTYMELVNKFKDTLKHGVTR